MGKRTAAVILTAVAYASSIGILSYNITNRPSYLVVSVSQPDSRKPANFGVYSKACDGKYDGVRQLDAGTVMDRPFFKPLGWNDAFIETIESIEQLNLGTKYNIFFQECRALSNSKLREI